VFTPIRVLKHGNLLRLIIVVSVLAGLLGEVHFNEHVNLHVYILAPLAVPLLLVNSLLVFLLSLTLSIIMASLGLISLLFSLVVVVIGFLTLYLETHTSISSKVIASLLAFTPVYIVTPISLIPVFTVIVLVIALSIKEYLRLSKSNVEVFSETRVAYLGELVKYKVVITCSGLFKYSIFEEGKSIVSDVATGMVTHNFSFRSNRLGVNEKNISVLIEDVRGFARIVHGPYILSFRVVARITGLLKKAERLIEKYAMYVSTPQILRVSFEPPAVNWTIPQRLIREVEAKVSHHTSTGYFGEYMGIREYKPGDNPRAIYWKKSLKRESLEDLYVKVYAKESANISSGARVLLADLTATNPIELDVLLSALYGELLSEISRERPLTQVHLFVKIPGEEPLYISGKVVDVVVALNTIIQKHNIKALYNYETWRRSRTIRLGESTGFISGLENYYRALGLAFAEVVKSRVGRKAAIQLIYSNALAYKYSIISQVLKDSGFMVLKV